MLTKKICRLIVILMTLTFLGCETGPEKQITALEEKSAPKQPRERAACQELCSEEILRQEIKFWIHNNDGLGFFKWLNPAIKNNGKNIVKLLLDEQTENKNEPFTNLFLSLTLSYPGTGFRNTNKALSSLDIFEKNWLSDDQNKYFSLFIRTQLEDRMRMVEQRSELRKKISSLEKNLAQEQNNAVATKTQLDQLKSVEKSLLRQQSEETKKYRVVK